MFLRQNLFAQITITSTENTDDSRLFHFSIAGTEQVAGFRVSESPIFELASDEGVNISIQQIAADSQEPWNYNGDEGSGWTDSNYGSTALDWVLVSFRTGVERSTEIARAAAILHADGSIEFLECPLYADIPYTALYVVIEHRNHMGVMSPWILPITTGSLSFDFRSNQSYREYPTSPYTGQKQVATGHWVMLASDGHQLDFPSYDIQGEDKAFWIIENGIYSRYSDFDYNLDGDITGEDRILWSGNNGSFSVVPR